MKALQQQASARTPSSTFGLSLTPQTQEQQERKSFSKHRPPPITLAGDLFVDSDSEPYSRRSSVESNKSTSSNISSVASNDDDENINNFHRDRQVMTLDDVAVDLDSLKDLRPEPIKEDTYFAEKQGESWNFFCGWNRFCESFSGAKTNIAVDDSHQEQEQSPVNQQS